uniref:Uncharacterized protein n=1 Tax=Glossina brevipalpis TaxID=37001 RepID=A0A1A9WIX2_9MUSC
MHSILSQNSKSKQYVQNMCNKELLTKSGTQTDDTLAAKKEKLIVDEETDYIVNLLLDDIERDIDEIAAAFHANDEKSKKNLEDNPIEIRKLDSWDIDVSSLPSLINVSNRAGNDTIFATKATQVEHPKFVEVATQTIETELFPKLSSIIYNLSYNQLGGFRELGELLLDPSISISTKKYYLQKIYESDYTASNQTAAVVATPFKPPSVSDEFNGNVLDQAIKQKTDNILNDSYARMLNNYSGNQTMRQKREDMFSTHCALMPNNYSSNQTMHQEREDMFSTDCAPMPDIYSSNQTMGQKKKNMFSTDCALMPDISSSNQTMGQKKKDMFSTDCALMPQNYSSNETMGQERENMFSIDCALMPQNYSSNQTMGQEREDMFSSHCALKPQNYSSNQTMSQERENMFSTDCALMPQKYSSNQTIGQEREDMFSTDCAPMPDNYSSNQLICQSTENRFNTDYVELDNYSSNCWPNRSSYKENIYRKQCKRKRK